MAHSKRVSIAVAIFSLLVAVLLMAPKPPSDGGLPKLIMLIENEMVPWGGEFISEVFSTDAASSLTLLGYSSGSGLTVELRFLDRAPAVWNQPDVGKVIGAVCELPQAGIGNCRKTTGTSSPILPSNSIQVGGPYAQMRVTNSSGTDRDFNISVYLQ